MGDRSIRKEVKKKKKSTAKTSLSSAVQKMPLPQPELVKRKKEHEE